MDTKTVQSTLQRPISQQLYLAFELSQKQWKLGFTVGMGQRPRIRTIQARDLAASVAMGSSGGTPTISIAGYGHNSELL